MQKRYFLLAGLAALVLLSGCASTVRTRTSTFLAPEAEFGQGTIAVQPANGALENSLEFELYRSKLEDKLRAEGYTIAEPESAEYIARLDYEVKDTFDEKEEPRSRLTFAGGVGSYWMTGFGPYYPPFYRYRVDPFHDPFFDPPLGYRARFAYDPWGFGPYYHRYGWRYGFNDPVNYRPEFIRTLSLSIARMPADKPQRVYEVHATSAGSCSIMSVVFDEMLAAIFHEFPGENGAVRTVRVEGETRCS